MKAPLSQFKDTDGVEIVWKSFELAPKQRLLGAYFTYGRNIDNIPTLIALGEEIGSDSTDLKNGLESDQYTNEVNQDILRPNNKASPVSLFFYSTRN